MSSFHTILHTRPELRSDTKRFLFCCEDNFPKNWPQCRHGRQISANIQNLIWYKLSVLSRTVGQYGKRRPSSWLVGSNIAFPMVIRLTKRTYHSTLRYLAISHFDKDINNIEIGWRKKENQYFAEGGKWKLATYTALILEHRNWKGKLFSVFAFANSCFISSSLSSEDKLEAARIWNSVQLAREMIASNKTSPVPTTEVGHLRILRTGGSGGFVLGRSVTRSLCNATTTNNNHHH